MALICVNLQPETVSFTGRLEYPFLHQRAKVYHLGCCWLNKMIADHPVVILIVVLAKLMPSQPVESESWMEEDEYRRNTGKEVKCFWVTMNGRS